MFSAVIYRSSTGMFVVGTDIMGSSPDHISAVTTIVEEKCAFVYMAPHSSVVHPEYQKNIIRDERDTLLGVLRDVDVSKLSLAETEVFSKQLAAIRHGMLIRIPLTTNGVIIIFGSRRLVRAGYVNEIIDRDGYHGGVVLVNEDGAIKHNDELTRQVIPILAAHDGDLSELSIEPLPGRHLLFEMLR